MRESCAEVERLLTLLHSESKSDAAFLEGMIDHKNDTIAWLRTTQDNYIKEVNNLYNEMINTIGKEIAILEDHLKTINGEHR